MTSHCRTQSRLLAIGILVGAGFMIANTAAYSQPVEEVTVTAPRVVKQTVVTGRSFATGAPIEETSISRTVSYADLDLVKTSDADELRTRVRDTAKDLCTELDKLYPLEPKDPDCVRKSVDRAMVQADNAIEDARK